MITGTVQADYCIKGHNGLETSVILSEDYARMFAKKGFMERETVKDILRQFNERGIRYCLIGGLALAHHAIPRMTQDVDLLVVPEDMPLVQQVLAGHQARGTAVVLVFEVGATKIDVQPANLRAKREAVLSAIDEMLDEQMVKVVNLRDLIFLKMWAVPQRPEMSKRMQDEADIVSLLEFNSEKVTAEMISYICRALLSMVYTAEETAKYRAQIEWLNQILEKLGLGDRCYTLA